MAAAEKLAAKEEADRVKAEAAKDEAEAKAGKLAADKAEAVRLQTEAEKKSSAAEAAKAEAEARAKKVEEELEGLVGHSTASNNWVISGKHTANGMPLLSTDPHLGATIPAFWQLNEIVWGKNRENYTVGASLVGMPGLGMGRTKNITWGLTAAIVDNSDLWEEELNEDATKYLVDGEWKDLKIIEEVFRVKGKPDVT